MRDFLSIRSVLLSSLASVVFTGMLAAQTPPPGSAANPQTAPVIPRYRFRVLGVYDDATGDPVEGVEVSDVLSGVSSLTSKTGAVSLFFLPDGGSLVRLRKVGYEMQTLTVVISAVDTVPLTVTLSKATQLATVNVNAKAAPVYHSSRLNAAEQRIQAHTGGYFIDEAEMRKHDNSTLANTLSSTVSGIVSQLGRHGETYFVSSRKPCIRGTSCNPPNCYIGVYIDGVPGTPQQDFSRMSPTDYAIAEFYPGGSTVPPEYNSSGANTTCGVLLLWTREQ